MKFVSKIDGSIVEPAVDWVAKSYEQNPDYEPVAEKPEKKAKKAKKE